MCRVGQYALKQWAEAVHVRPHCSSRLLPPDQFFPPGHTVTAFAVAGTLSHYPAPPGRLIGRQAATSGSNRRRHGGTYWAYDVCMLFRTRHPFAWFAAAIVLTCCA